MNNEAKLSDFDPTDYVNSLEDAAIALNAAAQEGPQEFFEELGLIARAHSMGKIADATGVTRAGLYRALSKSAKNTKFTTVSDTLNALGLGIEIKPLSEIKKVG